MSAPESPSLPAVRRLELVPERVLYVARAGLGALPSGFGTMLLFMSPQIFSLYFVLWAIWWPYPPTATAFHWAIAWSAVMAAAVLIVAGLLIRRNRGFITAVMRAPFVRITATDRRVLWTVPWDRRPLMDIGRARVVGAVIGQVDRRGRGNAAMELVPGGRRARASSRSGVSVRGRNLMITVGCRPPSRSAAPACGWGRREAPGA